MFAQEETVVSDYNPLRDPVVRNLLSLTDTEMASRRPELRALAAERLEMLWRACKPHILGRDDEGNAFFPDYRYVDLGLRIMDRQIRLLKVMTPDPPVEDRVIEGRDPAAVKVSGDLLALEARMRGEAGA